MGFDAVLPPPLSRAIRDARADATRAVRKRVDDFLDELDDELPLAKPTLAIVTRGDTSVD